MNKKAGRQITPIDQALLVGGASALFIGVRIMAISRGNLVLASTLLSNLDPFKIFLTSLIPMISLICVLLAWALFTRVRFRTGHNEYPPKSIERVLSLIIASLLIIVGVFFTNIITMYGFFLLVAIVIIRAVIGFIFILFEAFNIGGLTGLRREVVSSFQESMMEKTKSATEVKPSLLWKALRYFYLVRYFPDREDGDGGGAYLGVALVASVIFFFYTFFIPTMWVPTENLFLQTNVVGDHTYIPKNGKFSVYVIGEDQNFITTVATKTLRPEVYKTSDVRGREVCSEYNENFLAALLSQPVVTWNLKQAANLPACTDASNLSVFFHH